MVTYDAAVIGGGLLGCFAARNLRRWNISTVLLESGGDVCTGISRANSAVVYAGYDNKPGTLKAGMTVASNADFDTLCRELEVPFVRCGSLVLGFGPRADRILEQKLQQGRKNSVPGLRLISGAEALKMEPMLSDKLSSALFCPGTGTVNPWQLGIAAFENALNNGCEVMFNSKVQAIARTDGGYIIETDRQSIFCRLLLNCAGLNADKVQELLFPPGVRLFYDAADYFVFDKNIPMPSHIISHETESEGKGISAIPTTEGNLLLEGFRRPLNGKPWATDSEGMRKLMKTAGQLFPSLESDKVIRSFAAVRPNPYRVVEENGHYVPDGRSIGSFVIENPAGGFYSLIGVKSPGLTCAQSLGMYLAEKGAEYLGASLNPDFYAHRRAITIRDNQIVCQCENITMAEIREAVRRGARSADAVKRRVGSGMGRCQGSRCALSIERVLEEMLNG